MQYSEQIRISLEGIRTHKLQSFLTLIGIILGVSAVIAMLSIGAGAREQALKQIEALGINNIIVDDATSADVEFGPEMFNRRSAGLSLEDAAWLQGNNPLLSDTVPEKIFETEVRNGRERLACSVVGTVPEYEFVKNVAAQAGGFFSFSDMLENRRVCVLGSGIKRKLFRFSDPVGRQILIGDQWFTVLGELSSRALFTEGETAKTIGNSNEEIYIPINAALKRFSHRPFESEISKLTVRVKDAGRVKLAANMIQRSLHRRHKGVVDFTITVPEALLQQTHETQRIFNIVMGCIASISLLVGGIGIMNIMLASVLERTREIGIRRAVGAQQKDILQQFLFEAVVLTLCGGVIGVVFGIVMTKAITIYASWPTLVSLPAILLSFGVSVSVGIVFGFYPARKAAMLSPIEALSYE